jgi:hypothetical protein
MQQRVNGHIPEGTTSDTDIVVEQGKSSVISNPAPEAAAGVHHGR